MINSVLIFGLWRILIFIPLIVAAYLIPFNNNYPTAYVFKYINSDLTFNSVFLNPWANFDGIHYLNIAEFGYTNQARFFPLFPLLIRAVFSSSEISIVLVTVIFFLAVHFLKKLISLDFPKQTVQKSIIYLLLFPASFFFASIYSEGLFLLLTVLAFYFARKKAWFLSISCASLVMTTRFVGIAILPALLYEFFIDKNVQFKKLALFLITPLGIIAYALFNYSKWQNFLYFIQAQGELGNNRTVSSIVLFPQTIYRYIKILLVVPTGSYDWSIALLELISFIFASFFLYLTWKKKIRTSYLIFALVNFAVIISTGTFSALPRYILTIFPIFIALALVKNNIFKFTYIIVSPVLLFILLMLFSKGYFVA